MVANLAPHILRLHDMVAFPYVPASPFFCRPCRHVCLYSLSHVYLEWNKLLLAL